MKRLAFYCDQDGREPFAVWLSKLGDKSAKARIKARLEQLQAGNPGDIRAVGGGVMEMRIHLGPGYRVYFAPHGDSIVLLLCAGTKGTQQADIRRARALWMERTRR